MDWPTKGEDIEDTVQGVHQWALHRFVYVKDNERWAGDPNLWIGEHWETDAELIADLDTKGFVSGDCDAFAKLCWLALRKLHIPSRLVVCNTETGEGHLVCESEGWVMDNRYMTVVTRQELEERIGYRWQSMSGFLPGGAWTAVV